MDQKEITSYACMSERCVHECVLYSATYSDGDSETTAPTDCAAGWAPTGKGARISTTILWSLYQLEQNQRQNRHAIVQILEGGPGSYLEGGPGVSDE
jgi:hypothetical protein